MSQVPLLIETLLADEPPHEIPVWLMRQAGRYLPEYRELKEQYSFLELSENAERAAEVTLQPLRRFAELDAAILFADILTPSRALGFDFEFSPGPKLKNPIRSEEDISQIVQSDIHDSVPYVFEALEMVRTYIENEKREGPRRAVLGFAASPWTLACYLIDQGVYKQHLGTKIFAKRYPEAFSKLCDDIADVTIKYLIAKSRAGADAVQIFDTWGGLLSSSEYHMFSGTWIQRIIEALQAENIPCILYQQAGADIIMQSNAYGAHAQSIDWKAPFLALRNSLPAETALQGNFDPTSLFYPSDYIKELTHELYQTCPGRRVIANLGHGILPGTPIEGVEAYLKGIKSI